MTAFRCAWHAYTAPATSEAVRLIRVMLAFVAVGFVAQIFVPEEWEPVIGRPRLLELALWYGLLWVARQRDEARAQLAELARQP